MASAPTASDILFMEAHIRENKIPSIVTANVICIIAAYLAVVLRFISRRFVQAKLGPDDWWIVGALVRMKNPNRKAHETDALAAGVYWLYHWIQSQYPMGSG